MQKILKCKQVFKVAFFVHFIYFTKKDYIQFARILEYHGYFVSPLQTGQTAGNMKDGILLVQQCQRRMWNTFWRNSTFLEKFKVNYSHVFWVF